MHFLDESNQHEEKDTTVCFKSPKKKRRNSVEIKLSKKPSKRSKSVLATYKFTNNNTNNINNNLLECEADKAECNNPNNKGFTYKFQKRRTSTDTQFSASSRKNSMRLNRGKPCSFSCLFLGWTYFDSKFSPVFYNYFMTWRFGFAHIFVNLVLCGKKWINA